MRTRSLVFASVVLLGTACSDAPLGVDGGSATRLIAPAGSTLDQNIYDLFQLLPTGLRTAGLNRWNTVKSAYAAGRLDQAKSQLVSLSQWVIMMAPRMSDPSGPETPAAAAARLTLYMAMYIYEGPSTAVPPYGGGADNAVGFITPAAGGTVVTPTTHAGVSVPAGAVDENTIVVITENLTPYPANCSGPLPTTLCQYPRFYHFSQFPHERLNVGAKFAVCHVNSGSNRTPLEDHDDFRLAHNKPANAADDTPGSTIRDGIEILPLIHQTFSLCDDVEYALTQPKGLDLVLAQATSAIGHFLTPKSAYAIDQGGGGESFSFSDFNTVDPNSVPNDSVGPLSAGINGSGDLSVVYKITNVGTATSPGVTASFTLTPLSVDAVVPPIPWTAAGVVSLAPRDSIWLTTTAPVSSFPNGSYLLAVTLSSDAGFPDASLANNVSSTSVYIGPVILRKGKSKGIGR